MKGVLLIACYGTKMINLNTIFDLSHRLRWRFPSRDRDRRLAPDHHWTTDVAKPASLSPVSASFLCVDANRHRYREIPIVNTKLGRNNTVFSIFGLVVSLLCVSYVRYTCVILRILFYCKVCTF